MKKLAVVVVIALALPMAVQAKEMFFGENKGKEVPTIEGITLQKMDAQIEKIQAVTAELQKTNVLLEKQNELLQQQLDSMQKNIVAVLTGVDAIVNNKGATK